MNWYLKSKFGLYVTLSYEGHNINKDSGRYKDGCGCFSDGRMPKDINDLAENFDITAFVNAAEAIGVEYVNFTLYHAHLYTLCPSKSLEARLPGHSSSRDVILELLNELHKHGIRLQLYIHATVGDTMTDEEREATGWHDTEGHYKRWNDFVCEFFDELSARYGEKMDSYYLDMIFDQPFLDMIDKKRIRKTLLTHNKNVIITGNGEANDSVDYSSREDCAITISDVNDRCVFPTQTVILLGSAWWSTVPATHAPVNRYTSEQLFKSLILTAGANSLGGGMAVGCGPYCDRGFEPGVYETLLELSEKIKPIEESIKNTLSSLSYITPSGARIPELPFGIVATRSPNDEFEYLHVLCPPNGQRLTLPPPTDGKYFTDAVNLRTNTPLIIIQNDIGLTIDNPNPWDQLDTVIKLRVVGKKEYVIKKLYQINSENINISVSDFMPGYEADLMRDGNKKTFWLSKSANMHYLDIDLGSEHDIYALVMLPRQDGEERYQLVTHINIYTIWAGTNKNALRPVATGEWKRSMDEKHVNFTPIRARFVRLSTGPDWYVDKTHSIVSACEIRIMAIELIYLE